MEINKSTLGNRIKECRKQANMTQNELADILKVQRQIVSYYETGDRIPDIYTLSTLAKTFSTSTDYLLGLTEVQSLDVDIKEICEFTELNEKAVKALNSSVYSSKHFSDEFSAESLKLYNYLLISELLGSSSLISAIMLYKSSLKKQTELLKEYTSTIENKNDCLMVSELIDKIWEYQRNVEKDTKYCKYEVVEMFEATVSDYLSAELKAYTEALEDYKDKSNNVYKQRIDLLMEGLDSNADNNQTE